MVKMIGVIDFPDSMHILFTEEYRRNLFSLAVRKVGSLRKLAKELNVSFGTLRQWYTGKRKVGNKYKILGCPIWAIKKLSHLVNAPISEIEKHVIAYRGIGGKLVSNPKLPIPENKKIASIVAHLLADGSYSKNGAACYTNVSKDTIREFIKNLKVFGEVKAKIYERKRYPNRQLIYEIHFSKAIPKILVHHYGISFNSKQGRIPQKLKNSSKENLVEIIRAFIIDEGTIDDSSVTICSSNKLLIEDLKEICRKLRYECGKTINGKVAYYFSILSKSLKKLYDDVKPLSIINKQKSFLFAIRDKNAPGEHKPIWATKKRILQLLKKPMTSKQLAYKIGIDSNRINRHMNDLNRLGIVKIVNKNVNAYTWAIKNGN